ncbi:hypothetical protein AAIB33_14655 [Microbacterium sp. AZCO]|uniref:hypothetical protein n=1 Tax=Microbacterium sp. AZCO TaxID=3142976 RepID=UPI0031F393EC
MPDHIKPDAIPGADLDPDSIELHARTVGTIAGQVRDNGSNVHLKWQGMAGVYEAPEAGTLLGLMQPVSSQATTAGDNLDVVSAALVQFAADVRPIKAALDSLRTQAYAFQSEVDGGVSVRELNPAYMSAYGPYGTTSSYAGYAPYSSPSTGAGTQGRSIPQYHYVTKQWHEVQEYVDRNNDLISQVNAQQVALWDAERTCANRIRGLYGAQPLRGSQSEDDPLGYMLDEIPEGTEMPWGAPVERSEGCGEATAKFVFKDFLWEGVIVGGVWGTIEGLGTLVLGYNPATGDWFSGDAYGAAWGNLGLLAAGIVIAGTPPLNLLKMADDTADMFGGNLLPEEVTDFTDEADEALLNTGKALIAWDKWQDDPGTALGESVFNVGTILIPAGAAVTGVKTAGTAANVLSKMARVVDLIDPSSWAVNGALKLAGGGFKGLDGVIAGLDTAGKLDPPHIEVYAATDPASGIRLLDDMGVDLDSVRAGTDAAGNDVLVFDGGRVELPAGSFDSEAGIVRGVGGTDAAVPAPVREPELVAAGGVRGETGPGAVNAIVHDAPVRTETSGAGDGTTVVRDPETTTGGGAGGDGGSHGGADPDGAGNDLDGSGDPASGGSDPVNDGTADSDAAGPEPVRPDTGPAPDSPVDAAPIAYVDFPSDVVAVPFDVHLVDQGVFSHIDPVTAPGDATFWSGRVLDEDGAVIPDAAMNGAADLTSRTHGSTLEQLLERQGVLDDMPDDWFDPATDATWRAVSQALAQNASGDVRAFLGDVRAESVWNQVELPALIDNPNVTSVTVIDAKTGEVLYVYRR